MPLTTKQKTYLRGLGQKLRPQLHVGHGGYSEGVQSALEDLFRGRELIKGRILQTSEEGPKDLAEMLAHESGAEVVGVVGKTFILYRPNPKLRDRIELPPATAAPTPGRGARRERPPRGLTPPEASDTL